MEPTIIHVRAPATSANLGPAFDAAGIALDWWDELEVRPAPVDAIQVSGEQAELLPTGRDNLVAVAMRRLAEAARLGSPTNGTPTGACGLCTVTVTSSTALCDSASEAMSSASRSMRS